MTRRFVLALALCSLLGGIWLTAPARSDKAPPVLSTLATLLPDSSALDHKVVYVDFWASWCVPCRASFPWMKQELERYQRKGLQVVAVSVDKEHAAALKFLDDMGAPFPVVFDSTGTLAKKFDLQAMPTSFLYGRDGKLQTAHRGFYPSDTLYLDSLIRTSLEENTKR